MLFPIGSLIEYDYKHFLAPNYTYNFCHTLHSSTFITNEEIYIADHEDYPESYSYTTDIFVE